MAPFLLPWLPRMRWDVVGAGFQPALQCRPIGPSLHQGTGTVPREPLAETLIPDDLWSLCRRLAGLMATRAEIPQCPILGFRKRLTYHIVTLGRIAKNAKGGTHRG